MLTEDDTFLPNLRFLDGQDDLVDFFDLIDAHSDLDFSASYKVYSSDFVKSTGGINVFDGTMSFAILGGDDVDIVAKGNLWGVLNSKDGKILIEDQTTNLFFNSAIEQSYDLSAQNGEILLYDVSNEAITIGMVEENFHSDEIKFSVGNTVFSTDRSSIDKISILDVTTGENILQGDNSPIFLAIKEQEDQISSHNNYETQNQSGSLSSSLPELSGISEIDNEQLSYSDEGQAVTFQTDDFLLSDDLVPDLAAPKNIFSEIMDYSIVLEAESLSGFEEEDISHTIDDLNAIFSGGVVLLETAENLEQIISMGDSLDYALEDAMDVFFSI
ncbi:hypothetical protein N9413_11570 [Paracoccaceae bacterium]|nr:hypothetical protein [Paracoccaceae bacterium]